MKKYKLFYTKSSGLTNLGEIEAYCYSIKDGLVSFYNDEDCKAKEIPFKSINKDYLMVVSEIK